MSIYVSLTFVSNIISSDPNVIELPRQLFEQQESKTHTWVERIPTPRTAEEVHVEPLSCRDWELLEAWSSQLEDLLLQQVTIVYPGQTVPLQVSKGIIARVRIKMSGFRAIESTWEDDTLFLGSPPCLCLKSNTSVVVSPKPRPSTREPRLRLIPCIQDYSKSMERFAKTVDVSVLHVPPFSAAVHPDTLTQIPGYSRHLTEFNAVLQYKRETNGQPRNDTTIARIVPSDMVPKDAIGRSHPRLVCNPIICVGDEQYHANSEASSA